MSLPPLGFQPHTGWDYLTCLMKIHEETKPDIYLEIGTASGNTLSLANSVAISVDPSFAVSNNVIGNKTQLFLFQQTSDEFFAIKDKYISSELRPAFSFLDGMHHYEYLLRDFINTEKIGTNSSVISMHDCLPLDIHMATRDASDIVNRNKSFEPTWWTGDVWKVVAILKKYREDLDVCLFNAPPTGLVIVKRLNPESTVLVENYDRIISEFSDDNLIDRHFEELIKNSEVKDTSGLIDFVIR